MEDSRGVLRGACNRCKCSGYTPQVGTIKCKCGDPPGVHVNLKSSTPSHSLADTTDEESSGVPLFHTGSSVDPDSPSGDSNCSDQEDVQDRVELMPSSSSAPSLSFRAPARSPAIGRGRGRGQRSGVRLSRGSPQPITKMPQYSREVPLQSDSFTGAPEVSTTRELAKGMTGSLQLSDLDGTGFEEARWNDDDEKDSQSMAFGLGNQLQGWFSSAGEQEIPQDLLCIGCGKRQKRKQEDGSYYNYCGRTCSNYHRKSSAVLPGQPKCRKCGRPCTHKRKDGTYHDYCGMTCRDAHQQETLQTSVPRIGIDGTISASVSICQQDEVRCSTLFQKMWATAKGPCPKVERVFTITNTNLQSRFHSYRQGKGLLTEEHFHGTSITCNLSATQTLCPDAKCSICVISRLGFDLNSIGTNVEFQRFGHGFYLAPNSSKCHDYTQGCKLSGHRALLLCEVCPGKKHMLYKGNTALRAPPSGYDCIYGGVGKDLNYPEIVLYNPHSILPKYILLYKLNGTCKLVK